MKRVNDRYTGVGIINLGQGIKDRHIDEHPNVHVQSYTYHESFNPKNRRTFVIYLHLIIIFILISKLLISLFLRSVSYVDCVSGIPSYPTHTSFCPFSYTDLVLHFSSYHFLLQPLCSSLSGLMIMKHFVIFLNEVHVPLQSLTLKLVKRLNRDNCKTRSIKKQHPVTGHVVGTRDGSP